MRGSVHHELRRLRAAVVFLRWKNFNRRFGQPFSGCLPGWFDVGNRRSLRFVVFMLSVLGDRKVGIWFFIRWTFGEGFSLFAFGGRVEVIHVHAVLGFPDFLWFWFCRGGFEDVFDR